MSKAPKPRGQVRKLPAVQQQLHDLFKQVATVIYVSGGSRCHMVTDGGSFIVALRDGDGESTEFADAIDRAYEDLEENDGK